MKFPENPTKPYIRHKPQTLRDLSIRDQGVAGRTMEGGWRIDDGGWRVGDERWSTEDSRSSIIDSCCVLDFPSSLLLSSSPSSVLHSAPSRPMAISSRSASFTLLISCGRLRNHGQNMTHQSRPSPATIQKGVVQVPKSEINHKKMNPLTAPPRRLKVQTTP